MEQVKKNTDWLYQKYLLDKSLGYNLGVYYYNLYNYLFALAKENGADWCYSPQIWDMVRGSECTDHDGYNMVVKWKNTLAVKGYIANKQIGGEWRTYILKELVD